MVKSLDKIKAVRKSRNTKNKSENSALKTKKNWYSVSDTKKRFIRKCKAPKGAKLRASITPGTVLIILAGRFRGRRVVFLKQLKSGLLLVTGPYKLNGVPLKRVNQAYVIATKTKVSLPNIAQLDKIEDSFFKRVSVKRTELGEIILPKDDTEKRSRITEERKSAQSNIDTLVKNAIGSTPYLKDYLRNRFALKNGQQAHNLVY
jgi:large subunit ribosomal protein L6e